MKSRFDSSNHEHAGSSMNSSSGNGGRRLAVAMLLIVPASVGQLALQLPGPPANLVITRATCSQTVTAANAQTAVNSSSNTTICVQAGTITGLSITGNKHVQVIGPTAPDGTPCYPGATGTLTLNGVFSIQNSTSPWVGSRIACMTINSGGSTNVVTGAVGYRIDHNIINIPTWTQCIQYLGSLSGGVSASPSEGVTDHNLISNCRLVNYGEYTDTGGFARWAEPLNIGTSHANYFEDNDWTNTASTINNMADSNLGGRYVARFNTLHNSYFEAHSIQSGNIRAQRLAEIYYNTMNMNLTTFIRVGLFRGGTGLIFHNTHLGNWGSPPINYDFDNVRTGLNGHALSDFDPWGECLGAGSPGQTQVADGNIDSSGYPCRDQPGTSTDASFWSGHPNAPAPKQALAPWLVWKNSATSSSTPEIQWDYNVSDQPSKLAQQIQNNRDIFQFNAGCIGSSVTCTSGIGEGTLAQRPSSCTPTSTGAGPFYWVTDEGSWNTKLAVNTSGRMYKCTSTNTWTLYYTPYTYPHPLVSAWQ